MSGFATHEAREAARLHAPTRYGDLILAGLAAHPERTAFRWMEEGRPCTRTYRETAEEILRISSALKELPAAPTEAIALLTGPRPEAFTVMAAACHAGIRFAALHPLASRRDDEVVLRDSGTALLVVDDTNARFEQRALAAAPSVRVVPLTELLSLARRTEPSSDPAAEATYLFYTGGTTGTPKGVILRDRSLTANAWASTTWPWPEHARFLLNTPMSHAAGLFVAPGLLRGAEFTIHEHFDVVEVLRAIEHEGINATFMVPTMLYALLDHVATTGATVRNLRWLLYGAAPTSESRIMEALTRFGPVLTQHYGQAEAPNALTMLDQAAHLSDDPAVLTGCGRPMPGVQLELLDPAGESVPAGVPGELCVRGPLVMDGYWNKPEETAKALAGGWLHTGDIAVRDELGHIHIVDRLKDMIITGGFNVYPREVEDVLSTHPRIAACSVWGEPDERWGEAVIAAVVLRPGAAIDPSDLVDHVRSVKGAVWAPKRIDVHERLPLTALGKVDKKSLRLGRHIAP